MKTMMKCGHAANATDAKTGQPCCAICGSDQVAENQSLGLRMARCTYYGLLVKSRYGGCSDETCRCEYCSDYARDHEAFFEHVPDQEYDRFYCGCKGWE